MTDNNTTDNNAQVSNLQEKLQQIEAEITLTFPEIPLDAFQSQEVDELWNLIGGCDTHRFDTLITLKHNYQSIYGQIEDYKTQKNVLHALSEKILQDKNPCKDFNVTLFPHWLRRSIEAKCESTQAHPIIIASATLATLSGFIGKRHFLPEGEYFQRLYPNIWMININQSGGFKSTAMHKGAYLAYRNEQMISDQVQPLRQKLKNIFNSEQKCALESEIQKIEKTSILLPNRVTGEGLLDHLAAGHSGLIFASEIAEWLATLDKNFNADLKGLLTDFYDVPQRYHYKTRTKGSLTVTEPYIGICGVSTLEWLQKSLKEDDVASGFFARFLIFIPPKNDTIPPALPQTYQHYDLEAENFILRTFEYMDDIISYSLSLSCRKSFEQKHNELYRIVKSFNENCQNILAPYLKRWSPTLLKLAMLMQPFFDPLSKELSEEALIAAWSFLEPAIKSTALLFDEALGESTHQRNCRKVRAYIAKKGGKVLHRDLMKSNVLQGNTNDYALVLTHLKEGGEIQEITHPLSKDKTEYVLQPNDAE